MLPSQIFNPVVDRLLRLQHGRRSAWLSAVWDGLHRFPGLEHFDRIAILRGVAAHDAANRIVFRLHNRFPKAARAIANIVPIAGAREIFANVPAERPIVLAMMHFGPMHYVITVAMRLLRGRTVHIFHAGGETGHASREYFTRIGILPFVNEPGSLALVKAAMDASRSPAVIVVFDYLGGHGRGTSVPFLGGTLSVPGGLARIADETNAVVITAWWEARLLPRLRIGAAREFDRMLAPGEARRRFTAEMFGLLESLVYEMPSAWTEWANVHTAETFTGFARKKECSTR